MSTLYLVLLIMAGVLLVALIIWLEKIFVYDAEKKEKSDKQEEWRDKLNG